MESKNVPLNMQQPSVQQQPNAQPTVMIGTAAPIPVAQTEAQKFYQRKLRGLAISEIVLGILCVIFGATLAGVVGTSRFPYFYSSFRRNYYYSRAFTTGEGIWCGVWIIIAGALGIRSAVQNASRCMINSHLAFSILAAIFSATMFGLGLFGAVYASLFRIRGRAIHVVILYSILCILAFVSTILHVISATYCCKVIGCCGNGNQGCCDDGGQDCNCCMPYPNSYGAPPVYYQQAGVSGQMYPQQQAYGGQGVVYSGQPTLMYSQQPGVGQGVVYTQQPLPMQGQNPQQGYVVQGVPAGYPGSVPSQAQPMPTNISSQIQPAKMQTQQQTYQNVHPTYTAAPNQ